MSDPVETRGPEPADRSPEPADDREAAVASATTPDAVWGIEYGWDAAMAAADEREEEWARLHFEALEREKLLEARETALTEALREIAEGRWNRRPYPERNKSPITAAEIAKRALAALPVPVEGEAVAEPDGRTDASEGSER